MFLFNFILHHVSYIVPTFPVWYKYLHFLFYSIYADILITNGADATLYLSKPFTRSNFLHTLGRALYTCFRAWLWTEPYSSWAEIDSVFYLFILTPPSTFILALLRIFHHDRYHCDSYFMMY
jgi:hypothetical protein